MGRPTQDGEGLASARVLRWGAQSIARGSDPDTLCGEERDKDVADRGRSTEHTEATEGA